MEGRPATITRSDGCMPLVILSRSLKPVDKPVMSPPEWNSSSIRSKALDSSGFTS